MAGPHRFALEGQHPSGTNAVRGYLFCVQGEVNARVFRERLVLAAFCVNEQLPFVVLAIGQVEKEVSLSREKDAPLHVGAVEGSLEPFSFAQRQIRSVSDDQSFRATLLIECQTGTASIEFIEVAI